MWMTDYIKEVKQQLCDVHGFTPSDRSTDDNLVFDNLPDGEYPIITEGKLDRVHIEDGEISCLNHE